jgi:polysaccharide pyruvyl transferase WcaK-like protein
MVQLHIGHHFFGAGNLGDDLMLAGFLAALSGRSGAARLTCCIPWDLAAMRRRFPEVEWLPYDDGHRRRCIAQCDAWLGLGDTPFQTSVGDWLLDHLATEATLCGEFGKPMYYLGVGVNDEVAATHPKTAALVARAAQIHTRDATSARLLAALGTAPVVPASDLAHLYLAGVRFAPPDVDEIALTLNFEDASQFSMQALDRLVAALAPRHRLRWIAQEVRTLQASEVTLHGELSQAAREAAPLVVPDYANASCVLDLVRSVGVPGAVVTSRYHASLLGAWMGSRVVVFPRSLKVRTAAAELGLATVSNMHDADDVREALSRAKPVAREVLLRHRQAAQRACDEVLAAIAG